MRRRPVGRAAWRLALLALLAPSCSEPEAPPANVSPYDGAGRPIRPIARPASLPNLVLIVIDSLRADALQPPPGGGEPRMPYLASLAGRSVTFRDASASAPWTLPSMASLLTGLLPGAHGLGEADLSAQLVPAIVTYAEVLKESYGYQTAAFVDGPWFQGPGESVLQGFARRHLSFALQGAEMLVGEWARQRDPSRPFFLLLHTFEAHAPYGAQNHPWPPPDAATLPPAPPTPLTSDSDPAEVVRVIYLDEAAARGVRATLGPETVRSIVQRYESEGFAARPDENLAADLASAYWEGARWVDGLLERTVDLLRRTGLLQDTLLVVTSDHGELFGEHGGLGHGRLLYDPLLRVPLIATGPGPFARARVVEGSVGLVDVLPTFFDLAGLLPPDATEGRSALPLLEDPGRCRPVLAEELLTRRNTSRDQERIRLSVRTERWKHLLTFDFATGEVREEAYDLLADPAEASDLGGGSGRLPEGLTLDGCACPAVDAVRARIWGLPSAGEDAASIPYGVRRARATAPVPPPCRAR